MVSACLTASLMITKMSEAHILREMQLFYFAFLSLAIRPSCKLSLVIPLPASTPLPCFSQIKVSPHIPDIRSIFFQLLVMVWLILGPREEYKTLCIKASSLSPNHNSSPCFLLHNVLFFSWQYN